MSAWHRDDNDGAGAFRHPRRLRLSREHPTHDAQGLVENIKPVVLRSSHAYETWELLPLSSAYNPYYEL
jgi:hypothetical protein